MDAAGKPADIVQLVPRKRRKRGPRRRLPLDGRVYLARQARDLGLALEAELAARGIEITAARRLAIKRAAGLSALAQDARARRLNGDPAILLDDLVRLERLARLAIGD